MKQAQNKNSILIDWSEIKNINPNKPINYFRAVDELSQLDKIIFKDKADSFSNKLHSLHYLASAATDEIGFSWIMGAQKEYNNVLNELKITPAGFKERFPMVHRVFWTAFITLKKQYPDVASGKVSPYGEEKIDISKYVAEPTVRNFDKDLFETVYEVPKSENSDEIISAIIDAERPIGHIGDPVLYIDGKAVRLTQKDIEDEIKVHTKWQLYLKDNFKGDKIRFKISTCELEVLEPSKQLPKHR